MSSLDRAWLCGCETPTEIDVEVTTLDRWLLARPDMGERTAIVKIDVEGAEYQVLTGARNFISERRPQMIVEVSGARSNRASVLEFCKEVDYRIFLIKETDRLALEPLDEKKFITSAFASNCFMIDANQELLT